MAIGYMRAWATLAYKLGNIHSVYDEENKNVTHKNQGITYAVNKASFTRRVIQIFTGTRPSSRWPEMGDNPINIC